MHPAANAKVLSSQRTLAICARELPPKLYQSFRWLPVREFIIELSVPPTGTAWRLDRQMFPLARQVRDGDIQTQTPICLNTEASSPADVSKDAITVQPGERLLLRLTYVDVEPTVIEDHESDYFFGFSPANLTLSISHSDGPLVLTLASPAQATPEWTTTSTEHRLLYFTNPFFTFFNNEDIALGVIMGLGMTHEITPSFYLRENINIGMGLHRSTIDLDGLSPIDSSVDLMSEYILMTMVASAGYSLRTKPLGMRVGGVVQFGLASTNLSNSRDALPLWMGIEIDFLRAPSLSHLPYPYPNSNRFNDWGISLRVLAQVASWGELDHPTNIMFTIGYILEPDLQDLSQ